MIIESPPLHRRINSSAVADDDNCPAATIAPWSFTTNWTVYRGSLDTSITFESPDFPIESETSARRPPLVLVPPPSSDSEPCEIRISFTQKHEIRQVYVRSTSRVYEIYYAPALQSDNEYLCTVRCSVASVEENLLPATGVNEADSVNLNGPNGILAEKKVADENNNNGTNEDDWVEVKLPTGRLGEGSTGNLRSYQDYYEATAEINDSDPCMSITLRLLSLQNKGCVYVDEVYVFADPIDSSDSENQGVHVENPAGSKLMTMILPALLQSAKFRAGQLQDQQASNSVEKGEWLEVGSIPSSSTNTANLADKPDEKLHKPSEAEAESSDFHVVAPDVDRERICDSVAKNDQPVSQVDKVLEQLLSRVSRIEDICLRFEENMLKPMNSMEERLQRVEQQVELLAKSSRCPESPSCPQSQSQSKSKSLCNDRYYTQLCDASELVNKETDSNETCKPPEDILLVRTPQFLPTFVITAPEFSCCDEEEVNDVLESQTNSSEEKTKKGLSIDDALAAALAGLSSSANIRQPKDNDNVVAASPESAEEECLKCTQAPIDTALGSNVNEALKFNGSLRVTAPEFTGEEDEDDDKFVSPRCENKETDVSPESDAIGVSECPGDSTLISQNAARESNSFQLQETSKVGDEEVTGPTASFSCTSAIENDMIRSDSQIVEVHSDSAVKIMFFDKADILKHFPSNETTNTTDTKQVADAAITRDVVDFETPILEVKFSSCGNGDLESSLEVLLSNTEARTVEVTAELNTAQESEVQPVEEKETTGNKLLVELDGDIVEEVSICLAGEGVQQDYIPPVNQETFVSLI